MFYFNSHFPLYISKCSYQIFFFSHQSSQVMFDSNYFWLLLKLKGRQPMTSNIHPAHLCDIQFLEAIKERCEDGGNLRLQSMAYRHRKQNERYSMLFFFKGSPKEDAFHVAFLFTKLQRQQKNNKHCRDIGPGIFSYNIENVNKIEKSKTVKGCVRLKRIMRRNLEKFE